MMTVRGKIRERYKPSACFDGEGEGEAIWTMMGERERGK